MASIDIRGNTALNPDTIVFADNVSYEDNATEITLEKGSKIFYIGQEENYGCAVAVITKDIPNLIKALQKAVELGWIPSDKPKVVRKPAAKKVVAKAPVKKAAVKK